MTEHHLPLAAGGGKLARYTDVLWLDILLNCAFYLSVLGVACWIAWWWQERKRGVRGAAEKNRTAVGRRLRTRRVLAGLSIAGSLAQLGFGIPLTVRGDGDGGMLLLFGGLTAVAWLFALPLCRPLPRPTDDRSRGGGPHESSSYAHLPGKTKDGDDHP
ncbi:hypothetical protein [Streptomyces sp. NPDC051561]|uniref:hypothetical protein n=1 Tax=Streptomyces sp. NPDC051561 TaxID=3365658 RepID=UPI0037BCA567